MASTRPRKLKGQAPIEVTTNGAGRTDLPSVSVIVPTRNRAPYLQQLMLALTAQIYPADRVEVIIVDNSSMDETEDVVRLMSKEAPFPIRYHRKADDGPAASRNRGAERATGEILAFTDSDCLPSPGWIRSAIEEFRPGVGLVCGPIKPIEVPADAPLFTHQIHEVNREDGLYATANVFYRRETFLSLGGFNEATRSYSWGQPVGGDDTEFGWCVKRSGMRSAFAAGAIVMHQATPVSLKGYLSHTVAAQILPKLLVTIPELRETCFYRRYFLHGKSATFYAFVAGVLLSRKTPLALALTVPWLQSIWPAIKIDAWPPRRWGRAATRLVLEIESSLLLSATLLYSSAKNRRLVL